MKKKNTWWRNLKAIILRNQHWYADPKNVDAVIYMEQLKTNNTIL